MSDPLSTHPLRAPEPRDDAERETRIEELLLSGLDHYFAGQYESAISIWTRISFLDRHHDRAHAYIERARSAMAERQRESDEILHTGVAAYNAGDIDRARELLTQAVDQGTDGADILLGRLNRIGPSGAADVRTEPRTRVSTAPNRAPVAPRRWGPVVLALVVSGAAVLLLLGSLPVDTWPSEPAAPSPSASAPAPLEDRLPIVRASETAVVRARELYAQGRLHDALVALERVMPADASRVDADRLRAEIQRHLLTAAGLSTPLPQETGNRP